MRASEEDAQRRKDNRSDQILKDINKLSDQVRKLRAKNQAGVQEAQIRKVEEQLRTRWQELRQSRAGGPGGDGGRPGMRYG